VDGGKLWGMELTLGDLVVVVVVVVVVVMMIMNTRRA